MRALAVECIFCLERPEGVLEVCERYPGDGMEQLIYGRVLARHQLGTKSEARRALGEAIDSLPLVAKELTRAGLRRPKEIRPDGIIVGGADQTYCYWIEHGCYWKNTPGAIGLVKVHSRIQSGHESNGSPIS